jgi:hypothetical protein
MVAHKLTIEQTSQLTNDDTRLLIPENHSKPMPTLQAVKGRPKAIAARTIEVTKADLSPEEASFVKTKRLI